MFGVCVGIVSLDTMFLQNRGLFGVLWVCGVLCGMGVIPVSAASCKGEWVAVSPLPFSFSASSRSLIFSLTLGLKGASFLFLSTLALSYFLRIIGASTGIYFVIFPVSFLSTIHDNLVNYVLQLAKVGTKYRKIT